MKLQENAENIINACHSEYFLHNTPLQFSSNQLSQFKLPYYHVFISSMENSAEPDHLASEKPADLYLHCFQNRIYEPQHEIPNNVVCATNKGSDQPAHTCSLVRAFAIRLNIL